MSLCLVTKGVLFSAVILNTAIINQSNLRNFSSCIINSVIPCKSVVCLFVFFFFTMTLRFWTTQQSNNDHCVKVNLISDPLPTLMQRGRWFLFRSHPIVKCYIRIGQLLLSGFSQAATPESGCCLTFM